MSGGGEGAEVGDGFGEAGGEGHFWFPAEELFGEGDVGFAAHGFELKFPVYHLRDAFFSLAISMSTNHLYHNPCQKCQRKPARPSRKPSLRK